MPAAIYRALRAAPRRIAFKASGKRFAAAPGRSVAGIHTVRPAAALITPA